MGVLGERSSWCFCSGAGKSERVKDGIFSTKGTAMATILDGGTGFLIHRNLLLTTHANLPSASSAEAAEIKIHHGWLPAKLVPQRFFITSSVLDLTIVGLDPLETDSCSQVQQPQYLRTSCKSNLELGSVVYILGHMDKKELTVGEGKVVIATDNLIKLSNNGEMWCSGSAGFDANGNLAFMVCDPMKRGSSPTAKSSSTSSSSVLSWKKDLPAQFGIPIPIICDWLYQHWEGSLDELSKPKLPLRRLISSGQRNEHSCSSFSMHSVFKPAEEENDDMASCSQIIYKPGHLYSGVSAVYKTTCQEENSPDDLASTHSQDMPDMPSEIDQANGREDTLVTPPCLPGDCCSEVQSCASPLEVSELRNEGDGFSSDCETMYSAETMESRNYPSPKKDRFQQVGRSQSCVSYNRWGSTSGNSAAHKPGLQKQQNIVTPRKTHSQAPATSNKSHDYYSPTVSSIMKKRNNSEPRPRTTRETAVRNSPRWNF